MQDSSQLAETFGDGPVEAHAGAAVRPLGWWRFIAQFATVMLAYVFGSLPAFLVWGQTSVGMALSVVGSVVAALLVAWLWLRSDRALGQAFNLSAPASWPRAIGIGLLAAVVIIAIFSAGGWVLEQLGLPAPEVDLIMGFVAESPLMLAMWVVLVAWFAAGLGEELMWRGFLMDRLLRLRGLRGKVWPVIIIQALLFGLPHAYQGAGGMLITATVGLFLGWLRTRVNWNLWPLVIAHASVDTVMLCLGYAQENRLFGLEPEAAIGWAAVGVSALV